MTKEELEKEAEEYADWFWGASPSMMKALAEAYIKGAEPREKRITELETRCNELFLQTCGQAEKIAELEERISNQGESLRVTMLEEEKKGKRIAELEKENAELKADNIEWEKTSDKWKSVYELTDNRLAELEAQIEKMKCCANCKHQCSFLFQDEIDCANNGLPKFEIKEK